MVCGGLWWIAVVCLLVIPVPDLDLDRLDSCLAELGYQAGYSRLLCIGTLHWRNECSTSVFI